MVTLMLKNNFLSQLFYSCMISSLIFLAGCSVPGKVTGGGKIVGTNTGIANFGFNADSCEGFVTGRFDFHDKEANGFENGIKMNGAVTDAGKCAEQDDPNAVENTYCETSYYENNLGCIEGYIVDVNYQSTNPLHPGSGAAVACVIDNGEGINSTVADAVWLHVSSGPYRGYYNKGSVQGNIQAHSCIK